MDNRLDSRPAWFLVLKEWVQKPLPPNTSMSFSYLLGANQNPIATPFVSEQDAKQASRDLYTDMYRARFDNYVVYTFGCPDIGGPAISLSPIDPRPPEQRFMHDFDEMWEHYRNEITSGNFRIGKNAHKFISETLRQIET